MEDEPELRRTLFFLLGGKRGGETRANIIRSIRDRPTGVSGLAKELGLDYKAIQHHMVILTRSSLVISTGEKYGNVYSLTPWFEAHIALFDQICQKLNVEWSLKDTQIKAEDSRPKDDS